MQIEPITPADAALVAKLHAASWQSAYRGILTDEYLDNRVEEERAHYWRRRLEGDTSNAFGLLARNDAGEAIGFAWVVVGDDAVHGNLLDNLHALPAHKGQGVGRTLMRAIASELMTRNAGRSLFLWVYEENHGARAFYDRMQGIAMDRTQVTTLDGVSAWQWRYVWKDVEMFR